MPLHALAPCRSARPAPRRCPRWLLLPLLALAALGSPGVAEAAVSNAMPNAVPIVPPLAAPNAMPAAADATALTTRISSVTVYGSGARVVRSGSVAGGGSYVVSGLPAALDADSLRVRLSAGHVVSVEALPRVQASVPEARVQELRAALDALVLQQRRLTDQRDVANVLKAHLLSLAGTEQQAHGADVAAGRASVEAWRASLTFLGTELTRVTDGVRDVDAQLAALETQIADAEAALGDVRGRRDVKLTDVRLDVIGDGPAQLELEYLIGDAGWEPLYDLRTAGDGSSVTLQYRARLHQRTGEDWTDATVALSTAQPQRGARGPEPVPQTIAIFEPRPLPAAGAAAGNYRTLEENAPDAEMKALGYMGALPADAPPPPFAAVVAQGLSVQFVLPRAETILSREQPTTVLIGEQAVDVATEHYVTPALDTTVWLRGRAKNATPWTLLPGDSAVYFGNDFIGHARFQDPVLPGQEFTLHLGADPGLVVKRERTADLHEEPGFLGRRQSQTDGWRISLENVGAHAAAADGSVAVIVREAFPKATDQRVEVEIESESVKPSRDERWLKELDEQGLHTWIVSVPRAGTSEITWRTKLTWPDNLELLRGGRLR